MDNGRLLHDAWRLTSRHRFLWLFGLFVGGGSGFNFSFPGGGTSGSRSGSPSVPDAPRAFDEASVWILAHLGLLLALAGVMVLLSMVFLVIHFIARGALLGALGRLAAGEPITLGAAWALGRRLAWRYVRLALLLLAIVAGAAVILAVAGGGVVLASRGSSDLGVGLAMLLVGLAALVILPLAIGFSLVVTYAERAIAVDDLEARDALRAGYRLLQMRRWPSVVLWLITLVIAIGSGMVVGIATLAVLLPFGVAAFAAYLSGGLSAAVIGLGAVGLSVLLLVMWAVSAVLNTYLAAYWTLGYLGLTDRYPYFPLY